MNKKISILIGLVIFVFLRVSFVFADANWTVLDPKEEVNEVTTSPKEFKVILLGTSGPQIPQDGTDRAGPSQIIIVDEDILMIDCGPGAAIRLTHCGINPWDLKYLFFTHIHHYDHISDYPAVAFTKWLMGAKHKVIEPLYVFGPKGTTTVTKKLFSDVYANEIQDRSQRRPWMGIKVKEVDDGVVWQTAKWRIKAQHVPHSPNAFAYRVEAGGKSIVVSGDIGPVTPVGGKIWQPVIEIAKGADILVMDALHPTPEQIAFVAKEANIKTLVLSHFQQPLARIERVVEEIKKIYKGKIIIGEDLLEIKP